MKRPSVFQWGVGVCVQSHRSQRRPAPGRGRSRPSKDTACWGVERAVSAAVEGVQRGSDMTGLLFTEQKYWALNVAPVR